MLLWKMLMNKMSCFSSNIDFYAFHYCKSKYK